MCACRPTHWLRICSLCCGILWRGRRICVFGLLGRRDGLPRDACPPLFIRGWWLNWTQYEVFSILYFTHSKWSGPIIQDTYTTAVTYCSKCSCICLLHKTYGSLGLDALKYTNFQWLEFLKGLIQNYRPLCMVTKMWIIILQLTYHD